MSNQHHHQLLAPAPSYVLYTAPHPYHELADIDEDRLSGSEYSDDAFSPENRSLTVNPYQLSLAAFPGGALLQQDTLNQMPAPALSPNSRRRRHAAEVQKRRRLTADETRALCAFYAQNPKPNALVRAQLAKQMGMTPRNIQIWYQNKRAKARRESMKGEGGSNNSHSLSPPQHPQLNLGENVDRKISTMPQIRGVSGMSHFSQNIFRIPVETPLHGNQMKQPPAMINWEDTAARLSRKISLPTSFETTIPQSKDLNSSTNAPTEGLREMSLFGEMFGNDGEDFSRSNSYSSLMTLDGSVPSLELDMIEEQSDEIRRKSLPSDSRRSGFML